MWSVYSICHGMRIILYVRDFRDLAAVKMIMMIWVVTPCGLVGGYKHFWGTYLLSFASALKMEIIRSSETFGRQRNVTTQKTTIYILKQNTGTYKRPLYDWTWLQFVRVCLMLIWSSLSDKITGALKKERGVSVTSFDISIKGLCLLGNKHECKLLYMT